MTKFTPPTEFPHKCLNVYGNDVVIFGVSTIKEPTQYVVEITDSFGTCAARMSPEDLCDIPKVKRTWHNVYPNGLFPRSCSTRLEADRCAGIARIGVLRIDTTDDVATCTLEGV